MLSRMIEPYRSQSFLEQVLSDIPSTFVSGRLSTPLCFSFNATLLVQIRSTPSSPRLLDLSFGEGVSTSVV